MFTETVEKAPAAEGQCRAAPKAVARRGFTEQTASKNTRSERLYVRVNTLAGVFNISDQLLTQRFEKDYIVQLSYSGRNITLTTKGDFYGIPLFR